MALADDPDMVSLQPDQPFFESVYTPSPLVIVGTREADGSLDLAPKHMAMPMGWDDYFGFVCTPRHATYGNAERTGEFTVSYPRPERILEATLAAGERTEGGDKPSLEGVETTAAATVDAPAVADAYAVLECELDRIVDGFGENALVAGEIVGKHVHADAYRAADAAPEPLFERAPLLTYFYPDRYASVDASNAFPFPKGFER